MNDEQYNKLEEKLSRIVERIGFCYDNFTDKAFEGASNEFCYIEELIDEISDEMRGLEDE